MPNYILSRTSPPAHIYERKINLGYGIKVDTSDAPTNQTQKGKEMNDAKEVLDVADQPVATAAFADGTVFAANKSPTAGTEINAFVSHSGLLGVEKTEETPAEADRRGRD